MTTLVCLLEEPSAKALLQGLLPRLLGTTVHVVYMVFEGKQDLERRMAKRMSGWLQPDSRFVVLRDQDGGDCRKVKAGLQERSMAAGKPDALIRVACRELEAWVLGDLKAVGEAYGQPALGAHQAKSKFRTPDALGNPFEELQKLVPDYQKVDGARRMGPRLNPDTNLSRSFGVFCEGVRRLAAIR
ncbi:MAG: DUF4276 family protein [Kofleriaceae bacterium]